MSVARRAEVSVSVEADTYFRYCQAAVTIIPPLDSVTQLGQVANAMGQPVREHFGKKVGVGQTTTKQYSMLYFVNLHIDCNAAQLDSHHDQIITDVTALTQAALTACGISVEFEQD